MSFSSFAGIEDWYWEEFNKNMLLSAEGEELARKLGEHNELSQLDAVYSSNSTRAIGTAKYIAHYNNYLPINVQNEINERSFANNFLIKDLEKNNSIYKETEDEVLFRFKKWMDEILKSNHKRIAIVVHAKNLIIYLKSLGYELKFTENGTFMKKDGNTIFDNNIIGSPLLLKLEFKNGNLQNLENIVLDFGLTKHPTWWVNR